MRAYEFLTEAYHSRLATIKIDKWTVHIDSHAFISHVARDIPLGVFTKIITHVCFAAAKELEKVPRGTGVFIQDTNTKISIYVRKSSSYPLDLTVETVLSPTMIPKEPLIKISVPPSKIKELPGVIKSSNVLKKDIEARGRDDVARDLTTAKREAPNMNREQRRAFKKQMRTK